MRLADVGALPSYSPAYKRAEVLDRYEDNRPHHVRIAVKVLGIVDEDARLPINPSRSE